MIKRTLRCRDFGEGYFELSRQASEWKSSWRRRSPTVAKIAPALKGLRPESPLTLSLGLPISTYWLRLASRHRRFWLATQARFIMLRAPT